MRGEAMPDSSSHSAIDGDHPGAVVVPPEAPALQTRLTREYGLRYPLVGAGMGFIAH